MKRFITAAIAAAVATIGLAPAAHAASIDRPVRQGDFVTALSDTRATGHYEFLREGLHVYTEGATSTDKVAEYVAVHEDAMPPSMSYLWYGTTGQPGTQIVFDLDGDETNANSFNVIVGEQVYSTNKPGEPLTDFWYTGGSARAALRGITCPSTTGGSGSDCHGTLAQWDNVLAAGQQAGAHVYAYGFSLGSGVKGDGVLRSFTTGEVTYDFTSIPAPVVVEPTPEPEPEPAPTPSPAIVTVKAKAHGLVARVVFRAHQQGTVRPIEVIIDGKRVMRSVLGEGKSVHVYRFPSGTGRHIIKAKASGIEFDHAVVHAGR